MLNAFAFYSDHLELFGLHLTYYGLLFALAILVGVFVACKNAHLRGLSSDDIFTLVCFIVPLALVGARLYYVIFSGESYTFLEFFEVWNGGLAVYGGVLGGAAGLGLFCLIYKKNFFDVADVVTPSLILGQAIGRIGCYFGGCCYGIEVTNEALQWFPLCVQIGGVWHLSTFFYESACNFLIFALLMWLLRRKKLTQRGAISAWYLILYGTVRAVIELFRGDSLYIGALKVSHLLSLILIVFGIAILLFYYVRSRRAPKFGQKEKGAPSSPAKQIKLGIKPKR